MATSNSAPVQAVHATLATAWQHPLAKFKARTSSKPSASAPSARTCFRCGSTGHLANARNYPATSAKRKNCNKTGYFARVCHSAPTHSVHSSKLPEVYILYLPGETERLMSDVTINATPARPVSSTHSGLWIICVHPVKIIIWAAFSHCAVTSSYCSFSCLFTTRANFRTKYDTALLGMDLIKGHQFRFDGHTVLPPPQSASVCVTFLTLWEIIFLHSLHEGLFMFCRVPYGLASAFQKMMVVLLKELQIVTNYLRHHHMLLYPPQYPETLTFWSWA